ncbi:MspA family porin [Nocardia stercoris]|nr:MspA family porin [Nocardia stercoris]
MRRSFTLGAAVTVAAGVAVLGLWTSGSEPSHAQPPGTDVEGSGVHLSTSVDDIRVDGPGDRTPTYFMTFSHAAQLTGAFSVNVDGDPITSGQAVAGFILGCGISVAGGVTVGLEPNQGVAGAVNGAVNSPSISFTPPSVSVSPPSGTVPPSASVSPPSESFNTPTFSIGPTVGGTLGITEVLTATLGPGQVTTVNTATATLDDKTQFPYHINFRNAALNVAQCVSPVSAVPFTTATVSTPSGLVQTTAYGDQFTF